MTHDVTAVEASGVTRGNVAVTTSVVAWEGIAFHCSAVAVLGLQKNHSYAAGSSHVLRAKRRSNRPQKKLKFDPYGTILIPQKIQWCKFKIWLKIQRVSS